MHTKARCNAMGGASNNGQLGIAMARDNGNGRPQ
jgi:hypothetical protein